MNVLGWKTEEYEDGYVSIQEFVGYVFTIDGRALEFTNFNPLSRYDIEEADYLSDTQSVEDAPYLACCTCGYVDCDAVHAIVKFEGEKVLWTVFRHNCFEGDTPTMEESYCFDKTQYCQAIQSLLEHIKMTKTNEEYCWGGHCWMH